MERLTISGFNFTTDFVKRSIDSWSIAQCLKKLQEYEDAEEQGRLVVLPCKVGDKFWEISDNYSEPYAYRRTAHSLQHVVYCMERLGKSTFLTEKEAEAALEKMKGEEHE